MRWAYFAPFLALFVLACEPTVTSLGDDDDDDSTADGSTCTKEQYLSNARVCNGSKILACYYELADPDGGSSKYTWQMVEDCADQSKTCVNGACSDTPSPVGEVDGTYMLVVSTTMEQSYPVVFKAELATQTSTTGAFDFTLQLQPLSAADRSTPVGNTSTKGPYTVTEGGSFHAPLGELSVPGEADPFSEKPLVATVTLDGTLYPPAEFYCGTVSGTVTQPIQYDLDGSTFTFEKADAQGDFPEPPRIDCAGNLANPPYTG